MTQRTTTRFRKARRTAVPVLAAAAILASPALMATGAHAAASRTLSYVAMDDVYTASGAPATNTGSWTKLVTGRAGSSDYASYLKFKVSDLAGGTVRKATLTLSRQVEQFPSALKVKKVDTTSWTEAKVLHRGRPAVGAELAQATPAPTAATVSFDLTSAVRATGTYAFAITVPVVGDAARFHSAESATGRPTLSLTVDTASAPAPQPTPTAPKPTAPAPQPTTPAPKPTTPAPTTPVPTTPAPTTPAPQPTTPSPTTPAPTKPADCTVDAKLVPSCGILWGAAAGGFSETPRDQALREWEQKTGRTASVYHTYHRGDEQFPTRAEIAMANEAGKPRLLFTNWKVHAGGKWADVPAGKYDARIDKLSTYIKNNYRDKFFITFNHEPENDVDNRAGSGMTAKDFAKMYRHTAQRMKANGVSNAVFVVSYMAIEKFYNEPWWNDLYPGDDVVDWVGLDAYVASQPGGYHYGTFRDLMTRTTDKAKFPGFYQWYLQNHANKPLMLSEWGVHEYAADPSQKAKTLSTVLEEMKEFPALKGLLWFDTAKDQNGADIRIDSSNAALAEFRKIAADPRFVVKVRG